MKPFEHSAVLSDEELMLEVKNALPGKEKAPFQMLYEKFKRPILGYLTLNLSDRALAEDLAQDTFLKVFRARSTYSVDAKFSTWLWTIAKNTLIDHYRKKKELHFEYDSNSGGEMELAIADDQLNAEEQLLNEVDDRAVKDCLQKLPPRSLQLMGLRIFSEESYEQISSVLNLPISSVKTILHRSKQQLIDCIQKNRKGNR